MRPGQGYKKSARLVGEVLGKYHPHNNGLGVRGDVRMAQDFTMRLPLVDGQGNFGSVDNDPPAAMRYTEARMQAVAEEMLVNIDENTVDYIDNFDGTLREACGASLASAKPDDQRRGRHCGGHGDEHTAAQSD